jgi:hypothetical protein
MSLFGSVGWNVDLRAEGEVLVIAIEFSGTEQELWHVAEIVRSRGSALTSTSWGNGRLTFDAFELTDEARGRLTEAVGAAEVFLVDLRRRAAEDERLLQTFTGRLEDRLGGPPPPELDEQADSENDEDGGC